MTVLEFRVKLVNLTEGLTRFAYRLTADKDEAKDLVQETFFKALTHSDQFVDESNFKAWASTIMRNTFINNYRKSVVKTMYRDQNNELIYIDRSQYNGYESPDSAFSVLEITQYIEQLEDRFRIPFKMHLNGYKYIEIADTLCLKIGTVKSRIFCARRQLKEKLES